MNDLSCFKKFHLLFLSQQETTYLIQKFVSLTFWQVSSSFQCEESTVAFDNDVVIAGDQ